MKSIKFIYFVFILILSFVSCSNVIGDGVEDYLPTTDSGSSGKDILSFESEFQTGAAII
ncbi:MAG: hypothetical protein GY754_00150, partial [bacterium]|nr:hypothetical protein [bacterium]